VSCGALNRVPRYSIKRIPECGKCHAPLPEHVAIKTTRKLYPFRGLAILAVFGGIIGWGLRDEIRETLNPAPACTTPATPRPIRWYTAEDDVAPFTIKTASGSDYFVKLEDASTGAPIRAFYVRGGSTVTNQVPLGTFNLKYATGNLWCDEAQLFGPGTTTKEADHTYAFNELSHWTVELILQPGGNLRTHSIPRSKF